MLFTTTLPTTIYFDGSTLKSLQPIAPSRHILAYIASSPGTTQPPSYHILSSTTALGNVVMSYQRPRDFPNHNRPTPQRFLTPLGWAVRFPDGHIIYENRMGRQGPPRGGGFPSPGRFPGRSRQSQRQYPEQPMGGFPGQSQGPYSGQSMGGFPGQSQGMFPGQFFGQPQSQSSAQSSSFIPGMVITQSPGQMPGVTIIQPSGTGQSPGLFISRYPGQVLGQTPGGQPTQQPGGGWSAPPGPKPRQRFRAGPKRVRVADLKEDETDCPICYRDYYTGDSQNESEDAVRIGCGHVYGRRCLDKWIQETDTCPTCRGKLDLVDDVAGNP
ncbi:hypothetical protein V493_06716 [Pseudogymnoascus sp. VKM F-4281 (FW-2241)]|nr:hypothetical protein V493_06716 [Pseudogymnoascus sp. VKM F-4281 (FW-2241)]